MISRFPSYFKAAWKYSRYFRLKTPVLHNAKLGFCVLRRRYEALIFFLRKAFRESRQNYDLFWFLSTAF